MAVENTVGMAVAGMAAAVMVAAVMVEAEAEADRTICESECHRVTKYFTNNSYAFYSFSIDINSFKTLLFEKNNIL